MTREVHHNIKLIYASQICLGALFTFPVFLLYYRDKMGLNFQDFLLGEALFAIVILCLEIPTGWLSDKWSRKGTLLTGFAIYTFGYILLLIANNFWDAMIAQAVIGVAVALASGTNSALVYDTLLELQQEDQFSRIEGKRLAFGLYATVVSALIGGGLYKIDIHLPLIFDIISFSIGFLILCFITEPNRHKCQEKKHPIRDMLETVHFTLKGHVDIAGIVLLAAILFSATKIITWAQQDYFRAVELDPTWFGVIIALGCLLGGLSSQFGYLIPDKTREKHILMVLWGMIIIAVIVAGYTMSIYAISLLMVGPFLWGFGNPRVQNAINKRVGSERRAAILSTANMMVNILFIPLSLVIGAISEANHVGMALITLGGWVLFSGTLALVLWNKRTQ